MKIIVCVPENTIPYKCGERFMACIVRHDGKVTIEKCVEFFKDWKSAEIYAAENGYSDYTDKLMVKAI